jgi:WD40 repeat protein
MVRWISSVQFVPDGELPSFVLVPFSSNVLYLYDFAEKKVKLPQTSDIHMPDITLVTVGASAIVSASHDGIVFCWMHSLVQTGRLFVLHAQVACMFGSAVSIHSPSSSLWSEALATSLFTNQTRRKAATL